MRSHYREQLGSHPSSTSFCANVAAPIDRPWPRANEADRAHAPKVVLVGETAPRRLWPGEDPIGKPLNLGIGDFGLDTARVVGVVGDIRYASADSVPGLDIYVSYLQMPDARVTMLVRTAGDPLALVASLRRTVHGVGRSTRGPAGASSSRLPAASRASAGHSRRPVSCARCSTTLRRRTRPPTSGSSSCWSPRWSSRVGCRSARHRASRLPRRCESTRTRAEFPERLLRRHTSQ